MLTYFSFLLIPIWMTKDLVANPFIQAVLILLYMGFMGSQWFLLGKEVDHRFKIYFRANSSIDRVIYRVLLGKFVIILYFVSLSFLPNHILKHFFWGTWIVLGIFYSWPTRGKIIKETMTSNFGEFRFLDKFEKTIVFLCCFLFVISVPQFPEMFSTEGLKLMLDPYEKFSPIFWDFMRINYFPFHKFPQLYKMAWCLYFYSFGMASISLTFYALMRYFVSRRVSILGVFAILSSWSVSKLLGANLHWALTSTYLLLWVWSILWITKSGSYRSGLFMGLLSFWGTLIEPTYIVLSVVQIVLVYFVFLNDQTHWYRKQLMKYQLFGLALSFIVATSNTDAISWFESVNFKEYFNIIWNFIDRKAFFMLSLFGLLLIIIKIISYFTKKEYQLLQNWRIDFIKLREFIISLLAIFSLSFLINKNLIYGFSALWMICFFSLIPVEWIFQSLTKLRSKRNFIYGVYILICLLDSHIEGRIKIILKLFS